MSESGAARSFTESLLSLIRQQRHKASRVIIATQEPTIAPQLLDLCSVTIVHRFSSASWLKTLSGHIAGLALPPAAPDSAAAATAAAASRTDALSAMFGEIVRLSTGQGLLFGPTAALALAPADGGDGRQLQPAMLGLGCCRFRTRLRLSSDGGRSKMAVVDE